MEFDVDAKATKPDSYLRKRNNSKDNNNNVMRRKAI